MAATRPHVVDAPVADLHPHPRNPRTIRPDRLESILYGWVGGAAHRWNGGRDQDTVWEVPRPKRSELHPTMKPVKLIERAVTNSSDHGDIILDPFAGSGSTLIAAHETGRSARIMELAPAYCDVIRQRYADYTDQPHYAP